jgi:transposase-like protein
MGKDPHPPTNGKKKRWTQDEKDEVKMLFEENILNDAQIAAKMDAPSMVSIAVWRKKWQKGVEW